MSFYSDFIETVAYEVRGLAIPAVALHTGVKIVQNPSLDLRIAHVQPFIAVAKLMRASKIIKLPAQQSQIFLGSPVLDGQDYLQYLRLPFPVIYVHNDGEVKFGEYALSMEDDIQKAKDVGDHEEAERLSSLKTVASPQVKGVLLSEVSPEQWRTNWTDQSPNGWGKFKFEIPTPLEAVERIIVVSFLMPIPDFFLNMDTLTLAVRKDGRLVVSLREHESARTRMRQWVIHTINFLNTPHVKLVERFPNPALQKARQKSGKTPLPGWYEIIWRHNNKDYSKGKISMRGIKHGFRYDVRAHQKLFTKGRMAGRVIWCPAHQRGLRHDLYKPKVYRIEDERSL